MRFITALAATFLIVPLFLFGQSAEDLKIQIDTQNAEIEKINAEIATYEKELQEVGTKKQTLESALQTLDISRKQTAARISLTRSNIVKLESEIAQLSGSIEEKETFIESDSQGLAQAIAYLNEGDTLTFVEQFLGERSITAFWEVMETNRRIQESLNNHITELIQVKDALNENKEASEEKRAELVVVRARLAAEQESLDIARREQNTLLTQTKSQESNYQKLLEEKRAARQAFEQSLNELESKLEYTIDPSRLPPAGKGILRWPLDSVKITQNFGNTEFARSGAYSGKGHNGIDFRASIGTPVKAALSGTVEGTGNTDAVRGCYSYGKWVLIRHANGLSTLYAHLSQINVGEGDSVKTGQVVGYSGFTGYATGPHLHFTVYASNGVQIMRLGDSTGRKTPCMNATIPVSPLGAYLNPMDYL